MRKVLLGLLLFSSAAEASAKVWLVRCVPSEASLPGIVQALKGQGVNVMATTVAADERRDDLCGTGVGVLGGFKVRDSEVVAAKTADANLKDAPEGFPARPRRVH